MKPKLSSCPVTMTATVLSDIWTMLIMYSLLDKPMRFCELERGLKGISTRTLTNKLKIIEEEKLVIKDGEGFYHPTERGRGLKPVHKAMRAYAEKYLVG
ncbi:MAG: helix-turn-helix transcriptional regulator [Candidatus Nomurabacteria bacterium]|nr:helix-turn-helix transcriptional regulator [Candidatus Nomurabacteria bacterium]